jgi:hypothetical protein
VAILILFGVWEIVHPVEANVIHPGHGRFSSKETQRSSVHLTKTGVRVTGVISIGLGAGLACLVFYRPHN